jgi:GMP synthase-like glutamine amidotransferase
MNTVTTVKIYAITQDQNETQIILQGSKSGPNFLQGQYRPVDPSSIFAATRIFIKKLYSVEDASTWYSVLFKKWLPKFTEAELVRLDNGDISFVIDVTSEIIQIQNSKLKCVSLSDLQTYYGALYQEYSNVIQDIAETHQFYELSERAKNHFAIFNCEPNQSFLDFYEALYQGHYKNKGEVWKTYKIPAMEFPDEAELSKLKGIVISGSEWSVYDSSLGAVPVFLERLRNLVHQYPQIKIVGICFGCQSLAQALGGQVGRMQLGQKAMLMNREKIRFVNEFKEKFVKDVKLPEVTPELDGMTIVECHGDNIEALPEGATLYGTSDATPVEVWGFNDNVLAFQGHPEFNAAIMLDKILPEEAFRLENYEGVFSESQQSLLSGAIDTKLMSGLIINFMKAY